ncbi:hypothetical protein [Paenibacillus sp. 481]|uniref:hypothetical protein n=1 Tax=Paenibacillus sp. 481 TaxID=2835869 RepID=UPI001E51A5C0|nr:hypothetical protein [Paenibacillus sp. 481]UHA74484.1 hypothetical protein KIK04_05105 [Paenibacillus sp. 481]
MQVPGNLYNSLFLVHSAQELWVESSVWNSVFESVPNHYAIPDLEIAGPLLEMLELKHFS